MRSFCCLRDYVSPIILCITRSHFCVSVFPLRSFFFYEVRVAQRRVDDLFFQEFLVIFKAVLTAATLTLYDAVYSGRGSPDHAIAEAVSWRLPMAAARVRAHVRSCGICGGQSDTGADFLQVLRFPLPIIIPPTAPHSSSIIRGWYNRPVSGRRTKWIVSPHPKEIYWLN
jgi:hypothetical protein